ncbi:MAG: DUF423 domain-containing protein [Magnetococcales bacterium]|nr:DUF423 domain-containing protein [Magnetococcales bacterium]
MSHLKSGRLFITIGGLSGAIAVILGAYGAHALQGVTATHLGIFKTASLYHLVHSIVLVLVGIVARFIPNSALIHWSGWLFIAGVLLFPGTLYFKTMASISFGLATPLGGICLILAWLLLAVGSLKAD